MLTHAHVFGYSPCLACFCTDFVFPVKKGQLVGSSSPKCTDGLKEEHCNRAISTRSYGEREHLKSNTIAQRVMGGVMDS